MEISTVSWYFTTRETSHGIGKARGSIVGLMLLLHKHDYK